MDTAFLGERIRNWRPTSGWLHHRRRVAEFGDLVAIIHPWESGWDPGSSAGSSGSEWAPAPAVLEEALGRQIRARYPQIQTLSLSRAGARLPAGGLTPAQAVGLGQQEGVDYILEVQLHDVQAMQHQGQLSIDSAGGVSFGLSFRATVALDYTLWDTASGQPVFSGHGQGRSAKSFELEAGRQGLSVGLNPTAPEDLIEEAMLDGARQSGLL
ncbi:MAG: hypothetical protein IMW99_09760 [Firmicutes bacterium]|nr:hypothetical protein [Bacillota bacterium]